jgi:S-DNA-T family DNA segregation ATPase FtsK/SpoIIIE
MPSAKQKKSPPKRKPAARHAPRLPALHLEPHHVDLIGLGLVALGIFLSFVMYRGSAGGQLGDGVLRGGEWLIGVLAYAVPGGLVVGGALLLGRTALPAVRPLRMGALCLLGAALLWAGDHGGHVGHAVHSAASTLISELGVDVLAVFLSLAGVILVTGVTVAGVLNHLRAQVREGTTAARARRRREPEVAPTIAAPVLEPWEPEAETEIVAAAVEPPEAETVVEGVEAEPEEEEEPTSPLPQVPAELLTPQGRYRAEVTDAPDFPWRPPSPRLLTRSTAEQSKPDTAGQAQIAARLVEALGHFGVDAKIVGTVAGPHITRYELRLAPGIKVGKVANLKDDLAYALAAADIRIQAPIPGKQAVGVEVPNLRRKLVHLGDVLQPTPEGWSPLAIWLGKDVSGKAIGADLAKMPHLLVAGTTGAGKSACVNSMLCSLLLRATPRELRLVLIDPKQVELTHYEAIPHLLTPVITSPRKAANALQNLVKEMEERYGLMSLSRSRSLPELNKSREKRGEPALPYVLCVIDELADLMMVAPADVEDSIIRLAQKARAVGIHLVLATQTPRVDVITGMIKANVPSRIAFAVSSQTDSRVILDANGAETLLGQGDMLFSPVGSSRLQRIQGAYVDEEQIAEITEAWRRQGEPELREELLDKVEPDEAEDAGGEDEFDPDEDPLLEEAIVLVAGMGTASTSMLQRRLRLGYTRAGRLIDMLERRGVISGYEGSKPRQVLVTEADLPRVLAGLAEARAEPAPAEG